jgi:hypothetical protein
MPKAGASNTTALDLPSIAEVEKAIGLKANRWVNRCHEISCKMLKAKLVVGVDRYGHYYGPVSKKHPRHGWPFQRHGWIETPDKQVIDPTRWCFQMREPYLYFGIGRDYDVGGQRASFERRGPYPAGPHDESQDSPRLTESQRAERRQLTQLEVTGGALERLVELTGGQDRDFNIYQLFWLANLPLAWWGDDAPAIYAALHKAGHKAKIPTDYWRAAMGQPLAANLP